MEEDNFTLYIDRKVLRMDILNLNELKLCSVFSLITKIFENLVGSCF